jgi:hypothetical protein
VDVYGDPETPASTFEIVPAVADQLVRSTLMYCPHPLVQMSAQSGSWASTLSATVPPGRTVCGVAEKLSTMGASAAAIPAVAMTIRVVRRHTTKRYWGIFPSAVR